MQRVMEYFRLFGTPEFERATVVLALICVASVIGLFAYLGRRTRRAHFGAWATSYTFYAAYLAALIGVRIVPDNPFETMLLALLLGLSALFMFWGDFHLAERPRSRRELLLASLLIAAWSYGDRKSTRLNSSHRL